MWLRSAGLEVGGRTAAASSPTPRSSTGSRTATVTSSPGESGRPIPLLFGHNTDDPDYRTGDVTSAEEDERGLCAEAAFDPDSPRRSTPQARPRGARHDAHEHVLACSEEA